MNTLNYDEKTGIIRTVADGSTSRQEWEAYLSEFLVLMERSRSRHGRVLHLVDASANGVQPRDHFRELARSRIMHNSDEDQTAIVIHSVAAKMQIGQLPGGSRIEFFSDLEEAEAWLLVGENAARRA